MVGGTDREIGEQYPLLHRPDRWEWASITVSFTTAIPPQELVTSTHVVAFVEGDILLCRNYGEFSWFLPGGTREPGETVDTSLRRELMEEAGARLVGAFHPFGAHVGVADGPVPYRAHLPHPEKAWLWGWADAEIVGPPTNPLGGENVAEAGAFTVDEAIRRAVSDFSWSGELIRFASAQRRSAQHL